MKLKILVGLTKNKHYTVPSIYTIIASVFDKRVSKWFQKLREDLMFVIMEFKMTLTLLL